MQGWYLYRDEKEEQRKGQAPVAGWVVLTHLLWAGTMRGGCGRSCRYLWW